MLNNVSFFFPPAKDKFRIGQHGFDNVDPNMRATFMASGPLFKKNTTVPPFDNVDLYPLIVRMMGLTEPKVRPNGTMAVVEQLLSPCKSGSSGNVAPPSLPVVQGTSLAVLSVFAIARRL